jgi:Protein of unknown function (DUF742)/Conserved hypothetical ATP binding protein
MHPAEDRWLDEEAGAVVRPYALTRGRTHPSGGRLDLIALITSVREAQGTEWGLGPEHRALLRICRRPTSVADLAADLDLPVGVIRIADTRRLADCFPSVDFFENRQIPFVLAVNCFDGAPRYGAEDVRSAVDLESPVPVILCDARQRSSSRDVLIALVEHSVRMMPPLPRSGQPPRSGQQTQGP